MKTINRALTALAVAACSAAAWAGDGYEPPLKEFEVDWVCIIIAVIALVAMGALGFKSSRKTHQD